MNTQIYVCQLKQSTQDYIRNYIDEFLFDEGYSEEERKEAIENAMDEKLCNITHVLDMEEVEEIENISIE